MMLYKQHHRAARAHAVERRADQYRSVAGLARALVWTLAVSCVALSAEPALAASPPRAALLEQSGKISDKCSDFRNLATVTQTVMNSGGPLAANQDKIYVAESTEFGGARLYGSPVFLPAMASGAEIRLKIPVGTVKSYRKKLPGLHLLYVYLAAKGKKDALGGALLIEFPKGYCQPAKQPARVFRPIGHKGLALSRSSHPPAPAKPKLTIQYAIASSTKACDATRLLKVNVIIGNNGGPLLAHTRFAYVHAAESGGAHLVSPKVGLPAIPARETWRGTLVVGTRKPFFPKLPGRHTLVVSIGPGHAAPGTLAYIPPLPSRVPVIFPAGYCQPSRMRSIGALMRGATLGGIHKTVRGKPVTVPRHGVRQLGVRKKLTPVTPVRRLNRPVQRLPKSQPKAGRRNATQQRGVRKKLTPAAPVLRLNPQPEPPSASHRLLLPAR